MDIKHLRHLTGYNQNDFAAHFDIPVTTLRGWEQGKRTPAPYVINMIKRILVYEGILSKEYSFKSSTEREV